jgi:ABC-type transport system involved in Fe-S cluster assembly fused permease/ATPase subunit
MENPERPITRSSWPPAMPPRTNSSPSSEGYETIIGERGSTLSGGQRQRICLARAIIKRPFTANSRRTNLGDRRRIDTSHSGITRTRSARKDDDRHLAPFSGIEDFDRIIVLKAGEIIEDGTHDELLEKKGCYHELFRLQRETSSRPDTN